MLVFSTYFFLSIINIERGGERENIRIPTSVFVNPSQSDIGRISKGILDRILPGLIEHFEIMIYHI